MNSEPSYQMHRASKYLVTCLAALVAVSAPSLRAAASDDMQKLQEENAALRKQNAELQASKTTTTTTTTAAPGALATDEGVTTLSKFNVNSEKDTGYLKTNAATATRIGMEVQRTPLAIEIKSSEFLADTNTQSITDILRYTSSGSGDNSFAQARPTNVSTPQGIFTMRGFRVDALLRNGVLRYTGYNIDDVERVEVIKGPAALFFGSGSPGGIINYITKLPVFARIPTTIQYTTGANHTKKYVLDNNSFFSSKAAMRAVISEENSGGERRFEFTKNNNATLSLTLVPFESGKLRLTAEAEYMNEAGNHSRSFDWYFPAAYFAAYNAPTAALEQAAITQGAAAFVGLTPGTPAADAALKARYLGPGTYATWGTDNRVANNNFTLPNYTSNQRGAYYMDANGNMVHDTAFNWTARGAVEKNLVNTVDVTIEFSPFDFVDGRVVVTNDNNRFDSIEGGYLPWGDSRRFGSFNGIGYSTSGYYKKTWDYQFDLIFKKDFWGLKNKLLVGGRFQDYLQQYNGNSGGAFAPFYGLIPGASNIFGNPASAAFPAGGSLTGGIFNATNVPVNQVIRDRFGVIKTVAQVYSEWDPGFEIQPDIKPLSVIDRTAIDGYYSQEQGAYINYQGQALDDRLTILGGVRREMHRDDGQALTDNFPWFSPPKSAYYDTTNFPPSLYGYDPAYAGDRDGLHERTAGTSWMAGLSYQVTKDVNVYISTSKIYNRANPANVGGFSTLQPPLWFVAAQAYLGSLPGGNAAHPFVYNGATINTVTDLFTALHAEGADVIIPPETGRNTEIGVKTSLWDNKLVSTFSLFHMFRVNRRIDDGNRQNNEPLNFIANQQYFGPVGYVNPTGFNFINGRLIRWRTVGQKDVVEGADFEATWTPIRNFQAVVNGAWLWTAHTVINPLIAKPGSAAYNAFDLTTIAGNQAKVNSDIQYNARLENVPEYRFNTFSKYTITDGFFHGLSVGFGTRYSSKLVISRDVTWNPLAGGWQAGNYFVMDALVSYPWELQGYKISTSFNVQNLSDKLYYEGNVNASPGRQLFVTNKLSF